MSNVTIVQRILPHYRIPFFSALGKMLAINGIKLNVVYGQEFPGTVPETSDCSEEWATRIVNRYIRVGKFELIWQPCLGILSDSDLVIVEQANRLLLNHMLLASKRSGRRKIAYWGHGINMQNRNRYLPGALVKNFMLKKVDWWFAYTAYTKTILEKSGFPGSNITDVQNSIDSTSLKQSLDRCSKEDVARLAEALGIKGNKVGIYCGGIYPEKRIDFLIEAADRIKKKIPDFHLIIIGDGPDKHIVEQADKRRDWLHYIGPVYGSDRAIYLAIADVMLMPGLVGLAVVDSFIAGTPLITTDIPIHSPEIAYLESGENGVISANSIEKYSQAVINSLGDAVLSKLKVGCEQSAKKYTLDNMVSNFYNGINQALSL